MCNQCNHIFIYIVSLYKNTFLFFFDLIFPKYIVVIQKSGYIGYIASLRHFFGYRVVTKVVTAEFKIGSKPVLMRFFKWLHLKNILVTNLVTLLAQKSKLVWDSKKKTPLMQSHIRKIFLRILLFKPLLIKSGMFLTKSPFVILRVW